jgi:NAD(P)-dependent dehydrogenase (short-subunit alcohol dehydrogenase family)
MKLLGKKALVTGAARGIGRGCALELARAGADVAVNDRERSALAESVVAEIQALGRQAMLVEGDVFARPSCERVVGAALFSSAIPLSRGAERFWSMIPTRLSGCSRGRCSAAST